MKCCTKCGQVKPGGFSPDRRTKDGLQSACRACSAIATSAWKARNKEQVATAYAAWQAANPGYWVNYYERNKATEAARKAKDRRDRIDVYRARERAAQSADPGGMAARIAKRRAVKKRASPLWADKSAVAAYYRLAAIYSAVLGEPHHVDHIVPLQGRTVTGLHCEANLQVLPSRVNQSKGNRFECG